MNYDEWGYRKNKFGVRCSKHGDEIIVDNLRCEHGKALIRFSDYQLIELYDIFECGGSNGLPFIDWLRELESA